MILDGKIVAASCREDLKKEIATLTGRKPGLAFVLIGNHSASQSYVSMKEKGCKEVGIESHIIPLEETISEHALLQKLDELNADPTIDGILVQQPFPSQINTNRIVTAIDPAKDVDGFHPTNLGKIMLGDESGFIPCTPLGILKLMQHYNIDADSKHVVILGRSNIVGKPLASLLMQKKEGCNATVTVLHSRSLNFHQICRSADILISAMGNPKMINADHIKVGAVVIDVGINRIQQADRGVIVGDVDLDSAQENASAVTPVPGGVGPMTIAMLLHNTLKAYKARL